MPNISYVHQQHRQSIGGHENWLHKKQGSLISQDEQIKMLSSQPGLNSGNISQHRIANTLVNFASFITAVGNVPAISQERAKELTLENSLRHADNLFLQQGCKPENTNKTNRKFKTKTQNNGNDAQSLSEVATTGKAKTRHDESLLTSFTNRIASIDSAIEKFVPKFPQALAIPVQDATAEGRWEEKSQSYIIADQHQTNEIIAEVKDYLKSEGNIKNWDANDLEYYARLESAGHPVVVAHIGISPFKTTQQNTNSCTVTEQVLNAEGDVAGKILMISAPRNVNPLQKMVNKSEEVPVLPLHQSVNSVNVLSIGMESSTGILIASAKRWQHSRPHNKLPEQSCNNPLLTLSRDNTSRMEISSAPDKPPELINALPATKRAAWYTEDPTTGVRKEILLELKSAEMTYLLPDGRTGEFITYSPNGNSSAEPDTKIIFDEHNFSWRYANDSQREHLNVKVTEGNEQIKLYGDYYNVRRDGNGGFVIYFDSEDGQRNYIPVYKDKMTDTWHINSQDGHYAFLYHHEDILNKICSAKGEGFLYLPELNNNPLSYGAGVIYSKVAEGDGSNYSWGRYIDIQGKLAPLRNVNHTGPGVIYEIFDESNPGHEGYLVKWLGGRWLFAERNAELDSDSQVIVDDKFDSGTPDSKKKQASRNTRSTRILNSHCPSWETQYDQLADAGIKDKVISVRHRGDLTDKIAENSLSAFRNSYYSCRAGIETDVLTTKDNEYVIFHDTHIGKMMEPDYDPDTDSGPNPLLKDMTLAELKKKNLLDPRRNPTKDKIITVRELIQDLQQQNGQSLLYLEVKDPKAILPVAKILTEEAEGDPTLLKRVILKFNMAEFPTYMDFVKGLRSVGANSNIMANPVMSPHAEKRINSLSYAIPNPEGEDLHDNASRAVYWWSHDTGSTVANVEIVAKSTDCGFINVVKTKSAQGEYYKPASLDISNTRPGTMAYRIAIVKRERKSLGTYVPVADRIMWKEGLIAGVTVPNTASPGRQIDITKAYYNNDSRCCYDLRDRLAENEKEDHRHNLEWNRDIGANIITSDDTNTIDTYFNKAGTLDRKAMPFPKYPMEKMQSTLAWDLRLWPEEDTAVVRIRGWEGASSATWGGRVCLWSNKYEPMYAWVYSCGDQHAYHHGYTDLLTTKVVEDKYYGATIQISSDTGCLSAADGFRGEMKWLSGCDEYLPESQFVNVNNSYFQTVFSSRNHPAYVYFGYKKPYYLKSYGTLGLTYAPDQWARWKIEAFSSRYHPAN